MKMTPEQIIHHYQRRIASKGGLARAAALTPERRKALATKASRAAAKARTAAAKARKLLARNAKKES